MTEFKVPPTGSNFEWVAHKPDKRNALFSGPPIEGFREGWAVVMGIGKSHHMRVEREVLVTACGIEKRWRPTAYIFAPGNWDRCQKCERAMARTVETG